MRTLAVAALALLPRAGEALPMRRRAVAALLLAAAFGAPAARAAEPTVSVTVEPTRIAVGDRVRLVLEVEHDAGASVAWPEPEGLEPFEVLERRVGEPRVEDGRAVSRAELVLTAFELGDLELPALAVEVVGADGAVAALAAEAPPITVTSVGLDEGGDIRAIKGPLDVPLNVLALWPWLAAILALAGVAFWLWRRPRRAVADGASVPAAPPRPPHERAYEALRRLEAERLPERGEIKTFHVRASDVVRAYVEGRFGVEALEMTTAEVVDGLRRRGAAEEVVVDLRRLLERCDLVKFAKDRPVLERCREVVPAARGLVDRTRPVAPPPEAAPDAGAAPAEAGAA